MKLYTFKRTQILPITLENAWDFFSTPTNLSRITPARMKFEILHISGGGIVYAGQIINYKLTLLPGLKVRWTTEITHVEPGSYFIDEQRFGPYAFWHHQHHFRETANGVEMTDEVTYGIPFGFLGRLANSLFVERELRRIFDYRFDVLEKYFNNAENQHTKT